MTPDTSIALAVIYIFFSIILLLAGKIRFITFGCSVMFLLSTMFSTSHLNSPQDSSLQAFAIIFIFGGCGLFFTPDKYLTDSAKRKL